MDQQIEKIAIRDDVIRLGQFLKLSALAATGGEAKIRIQEGEVKVNGVVETRRGAQLRRGDQVSVDGRVCEVG